MFTIFSSSLNSESHSRILARAALALFQEREETAQLIDLAELDLPLCDAGSCYSHPAVKQCYDAIDESQAILLAAPVYNYDVSACAKNLIELTGKAWSNKVVGFMVTAGGSGSYMSVMGLANSLMLDFRVTVIPRFVYATGDCFAAGRLEDLDTQQRLSELVAQTVRYGLALSPDVERTADG